MSWCREPRIPSSNKRFKFADIDDRAPRNVPLKAMAVKTAAPPINLKDINSVNAIAIETEDHPSSSFFASNSNALSIPECAVIDFDFNASSTLSPSSFEPPTKKFKVDTDHWGTPDFVWDVINQLIPLPEGKEWHDPSPMYAMRNGVPTDGLVDEWKEFNYINPPYSEAGSCEKWLKRGIRECLKGKTCLFLLPYRKELWWYSCVRPYFKSYWVFVDKVLFVNGNIPTTSSTTTTTFESDEYGSAVPEVAKAKPPTFRSVLILFDPEAIQRVNISDTRFLCQSEMMTIKSKKSGKTIARLESFVKL